MVNVLFCESYLKYIEFWIYKNTQKEIFLYDQIENVHTSETLCQIFV